MTEDRTQNSAAWEYALWTTMSMLPSNPLCQLMIHIPPFPHIYVPVQKLLKQLHLKNFDHVCLHHRPASMFQALTSCVKIFPPTFPIHFATPLKLCPLALTISPKEHFFDFVLDPIHAFHNFINFYRRQLDQKVNLHSQMSRGFPGSGFQHRAT